MPNDDMRKYVVELTLTVRSAVACCLDVAEPVQIASSANRTRSQPSPLVHAAPPVAVVLHTASAGTSELAVQHSPEPEHALDGLGDAGGCTSSRGGAGGGGDGAGGGGDGGLLDSRVPQSTQSVANVQRLYSDPGPPSSQSPSEL